MLLAEDNAVHQRQCNLVFTDVQMPENGRARGDGGNPRQSEGHRAPPADHRVDRARYDDREKCLARGNGRIFDETDSFAGARFA